MERYTITIFGSEEDAAYIATVEGLEGCSAWGETREEALKEIKLAMGLWLQSARDHGSTLLFGKDNKNFSIETIVKHLRGTKQGRRK